MPAAGGSALTPEQQQGEGLTGGRGLFMGCWIRVNDQLVCACCQAHAHKPFPLLLAALLQQVMSLTPQQIELLPPQQKAQVLALQQQLGHR
jgi:hypothetical protein